MTKLWPFIFSCGGGGVFVLVLITPAASRSHLNFFPVVGSGVSGFLNTLVVSSASAKVVPPRVVLVLTVLNELIEGEYRFWSPFRPRIDEALMDELSDRIDSEDESVSTLRRLRPSTLLL